MHRVKSRQIAAAVAPCLLEAMEARRMFSVVASAGAGTLYVYGDNQSNGISIEGSNNDIVVKSYGNNGYAEIYRVKANKVNTVRVYGRDGADTITVEDGLNVTSYLSGERGADYLKGGGTHTYLYGQSANPAIGEDDGAADILVTGGLSDANMCGNNGDDQFYFDRSQVDGIGGWDVAYGGNGNDTFHAFRDQRQYHTMVGGAGTDTADFSEYGAAVDILMNGLETSGGRLGSVLEKNYRVDADVENAIGTQFADQLIGPMTGSTANRLTGLGGNDTIQGWGGNDVLDGGDGNDRIEDKFDGNDTIYGGAGNDLIDAGMGNDRVYGGKGNDTINGGYGNDKLYGEAGNDSITGGTGVDWLVGGADNDYLFANDGEFNDLVFGGNDDGSHLGHDFAMIDKPASFFQDFAFAVDTLIKV